jgi:hypothetical protein
MYHTEISSLLDMVDRGCRRLMKEGGGPLPKDGLACLQKHRATPEQKQAALVLGRAGLHTLVEIARAVSMRPQTVAGLCRRNKISLPCGYKGRRADAYYAERDGRVEA